jgi:Zn-dependent alcohol dehydrogenase
MKSHAAVLRGVGQKWEVEELDVDPPKAGEVLVEWKVAGLCHSDEHLVTGDVFPPPELLETFGRDIGDFFPIVGGHEGAGVVIEVGPGVGGLEVGDHVASSFIPSCGRCESCVGGSQNLCDNGAQTLGGGMITDGTHRHHLDGTGMPLMAKVGTFSNYACVSETSIVRVERHFPFECVALVSCGVATRWGSAGPGLVSGRARRWSSSGSVAWG